MDLVAKEREILQSIEHQQLLEDIKSDDKIKTNSN